ncbi:hypothetical protein GF412_05425 [Candidatus Micrarchaeota archaeon]|nr:hypothetical protein [Candidatus Micrarchaeota archaeon]MBD3418392.1 hypothetical protein [Candidatus Micrarchaeota archaeon]
MGTDGSDRKKFSGTGKKGLMGQGPPPIPEAAKRPCARPPPLPGQSPEQDEPTNPRIYRDQLSMLETLASFYPDEAQVLRKNGNAKPVLQRHLKHLKDELLMQLEGTTNFFFRIPLRHVAIGATFFALAAGGLAFHSCTKLGELQRSMQETEKNQRELQQEIKKLETQLEGLAPKEKQKPKKTSFLPRCLKSPPQKPMQKTIPKRKPIRRAAYS